MKIVRFLNVVINLIMLGLFAITLYLAAFLPKPWLTNWYNQLCSWICQVIINLLGLEITVHNRERLTQFPQAIFISNHPSEIEIFFFLPLLKSTSGLFEREILQLPFIGRIFAATAKIFIDRNDASSRQIGLIHALNHLKSGNHLVILPEGKCSQPLREKFHLGAFALSFQTNLPIVPIYIDYRDKQAFKAGRGIKHHQLILRIFRSKNRKVDIYCFKPVMPTTYQDYKTYCDAVYRQYVEWQTYLMDGQRTLWTSQLG